jgi:hypothetical protein
VVSDAEDFLLKRTESMGMPEEIYKRHRDAIFRYVETWEDLCRICTDELQQDMQLEIKTTCEGTPLDGSPFVFRWHPGRQQAYML